MTPAEFERLPRDPGWRYEYASGVALISPRHIVVQMRVPVTPRAVNAGDFHLRPVAPDDAPDLVPAFFEGFQDTVEYCDCSKSQIRRCGEEAIATFFSGKRGQFHPASRLAISPADPGAIAGAALVVEKPDGPFLDMLFIRALWHRRGLATALVASVLNALHEAGAAHLGSAYNLANAPSRAWHESLGFVERPTAILARLRAQNARHELWRLQEAGEAGGARCHALQAEAQHWEDMANSLEKNAVGHRGALKA